MASANADAAVAPLLPLPPLRKGVCLRMEAGGIGRFTPRSRSRLPIPQSAKADSSLFAREPISPFIIHHSLFNKQKSSPALEAPGRLLSKFSDQSSISTGKRSMMPITLR